MGKPERPKPDQRAGGRIEYLFSHRDHSVYPGERRELAADGERDSERGGKRESGTATDKRRLVELEWPERLHVNLT
jgi:hypothetical protein